MRSTCRCVCKCGLKKVSPDLTCSTGAQENKGGSRRTPEPWASLCLLQLLPESRVE